MPSYRQRGGKPTTSGGGSGGSHHHHHHYQHNQHNHHQYSSSPSSSSGKNGSHLSISQLSTSQEPPSVGSAAASKSESLYQFEARNMIQELQMSLTEVGCA